MSNRMRMTRDAYAREVLKAIQAIQDGGDHIACPRESCEHDLIVFVASLRAGTAVVCPEHGVIYRT